MNLFKKLDNIIYKKKLSFISGIFCGLTFAPVFFLPGIFAISILLKQIKNSESRKQATKFGYFFGFGFFLATLYWICFGVAVYIEQFWWAIPFALFGLPAFLAIFIALLTKLTYFFKNNKYLHFIFCLLWIFTEWVLSWVLTGFPWASLGYAFNISDVFIQPASIFGIYGLSFIAVYIGSSLYERDNIFVRIISSIILIILMSIYGYLNLKQNPTKFSNINIRIIQPSISQSEKWDYNKFWENFKKLEDLSRKKSKKNLEPNIIVWPEAALVVPIYYPKIYNKLTSILTNDNQVLIFGGISDNDKFGAEYEIYSSMMGINKQGNILFDYHKSHLVPFGEYMPYNDFIPLKKLTPGIIDYTPGTINTVEIEKFNLKIQPLICYEAIFSQEVVKNNKNVDLIINIANDDWYGKSSGPYQHFEITRIRAIENGVPIIRSSNSGISAIIDPVGRIIESKKLGKTAILDGKLPIKLGKSTFFSKYNFYLLIALLLFVLLIQLIIDYTLARLVK